MGRQYSTLSLSRFTQCQPDNDRPPTYRLASPEENAHREKIRELLQMANIGSGAEKNQTRISQDIEEKILSMYAKGVSTGDIKAHIQEIYGASV